MRIGYARVSTQGQSTYGTSLEQQKQQLLDAGAEKVYSEAYTGTSAHRPVYDECIAQLHEGDELLVTKMDRFARSAVNGIAALDELASRGIRVTVLNMGTFDDTPTGRLMRTMMLAFAEFDRDMIVEKLSEGLAAAKAKNPDLQIGRPRKDVDYAAYVPRVQSGELTINEACAQLGISRRTWERHRSEVA